ncbi:MAG: sigma-70 family RNA polymerase sigma factor [Phycisphaeraceae bacterium]|nr:sigma-70 family RNA polymerase sigma factor [Phycisphaerae bacterium]MBX3391833.1 sigma-70 family RNA polymerase sigma factor [Phycisphaeraceae bacterium]HRJ49156.1 RNA polymerase sigma factor [Phycisphaerales bacterium]
MKAEITPSHETLLAEALKGDRPSLVKLLEALGPVARSRIEHKITPPWNAMLDADDVMQVTYMEVVTRLSTFKTGGAGGFLAWLTRMAENNLIDAIRALESSRRPGPSKRVTPVSPEDSSDMFLQLMGMNSITPSRDAAKDEAGRFLESALRTLPPDYEKVIRLYDLEGKSITEVASAMGRSEGATWMLRARAHDRLREALGGEEKFFSTPA